MATRLGARLVGCALLLVATLLAGAATAWANGGTYDTHSFGANFAEINFGDTCDHSNTDLSMDNFQNDKLKVRFHGQFATAPWHVDSMDLTNTSTLTIDWVRYRWAFLVNNVEEPVEIPVPPLEPGQKVTIPVDVTTGDDKIVAVTYPIASGYCGETRLFVDHG